MKSKKSSYNPFKNLHFKPLFVRFEGGVLHILSILTIELKRNKFEAIRRAFGWLIIATPILWVLLGLVDVTRQLNGSLERNNEILNPIIKVWTSEELRMEELEKELIKANERIKKLEDFDKKLEEGDKEAVRSYIMDKFGKDGKVAVAVATAESGLTCKRYQDWLNKNKTVDHGVFQINSVHLARVQGNAEKLLDCKTNINVAYDIYSEQGQSFNAWVAYKNKAYLKYL